MLVGWCHSTAEGSAVFPAPERLHLPKDPSPTKRGALSCPAVRATAQGFYVVTSPFSLRLRYRQTGEVGTFVPVYPFTTINDAKLAEWLRVEPRNCWRSETITAFQFPSPYLFLTDEYAEIEQCHPILSEVSSLNWRLIPGRFDIYGWQRPLNWAIEWDTRCGDLIIRVGDPLYYVRFYDKAGSLITSPNLVKVELTEQIRKRVAATAGVTAIQRGTIKLIRSASVDRTGQLIEAINGE